MGKGAGRKNSRIVAADIGDPVEGIILLDLSLRSIAADSGGRTILGELRQSDAAECPLPGLPPEIEKPLREVATPELNTATLRISTDASHYTCEVFLMQPQNGLAEPLVALYIKREQSVVEAVRRASSLYGLTEREEETLLGIASGLTSRQIAAKMKISPNTVNAFLRLIMLKMGVTTRAGVVGKLVNGNDRNEAKVEPANAAQHLRHAFPKGNIKPEFNG